MQTRTYAHTHTHTHTRGCRSWCVFLCVCMCYHIYLFAYVLFVGSKPHLLPVDARLEGFQCHAGCKYSEKIQVSPSDLTPTRWCDQ